MRSPRLVDQSVELSFEQRRTASLPPLGRDSKGADGAGEWAELAREASRRRPKVGSRYCSRFQVGNCAPGVLCPYGYQHLHVPECDFHARGECRAGALCALRHDGQPAWQRELAPPKPALTVGHIPVLCEEAVRFLVRDASGVYVDGTFGRGGHSTHILRQLSPQGRLIAFDVDPSAIAVGRQLESQDERFEIIHEPFGNLADAAAPGTTLSGVLLDIGFSSPQMDEGHRGWSVMRDGPLDLRMNPQASQPASVWLQRVSVQELAWVFHRLGDEDDPLLAQRLAEGVLEQQRRAGKFTSTMQLGGAIRHVMGSCTGSSKVAGAKLPMRALTAFLNREMEQLVDALQGSFHRLCLGGRLVVITFKPSEEAVVQRFLRMHEDLPDRGCFSHRDVDAERLMQLFPLLRTSESAALRRVCDPIYTSHAEIARNRRSRSAALQVLEKVPRSQRCRVTPERHRSHPARAPSNDLLYPSQESGLVHGALMPVRAPELAATSTGFDSP